jgi:hypothetical protein
MNALTTHWIDQGKPLGTRPPRELGSDDDLMHRRGMVRVVTGPEGTEVRWSAFAPGFAALFYVAEWLSDLPGPYMLRYFLAGWFEEGLETAAAASRRILEIVHRSDVHLVRRAFVREFDPGAKLLPPLLQEALIDGAAKPEFSVDCSYEESSGRFKVDRIGPKSTIARLWGLTPVSYPCLAGGSYDRIVSAAYADVLRDGRPRYDHVYAAMVTPESTVVWIPYQRVITPKHRDASRRSVSIVTEIAKVDIQII